VSSVDSLAWSATQSRQSGRSNISRAISAAGSGKGPPGRREMAQRNTVRHRSRRGLAVDVGGVVRLVLEDQPLANAALRDDRLAVGAISVAVAFAGKVREEVAHRRLSPG